MHQNNLKTDNRSKLTYGVFASQIFQETAVIIPYSEAAIICDFARYAKYYKTRYFTGRTRGFKIFDVM